MNLLKAKKLMGDASSLVKVKYTAETHELLEDLTKSDPNFFFDWQLNNYLSMLEEQEKIMKELESVNCPVFMALSSQSDISDLKLAKEAFNKFSSKDKKI